MKVYLQVVGGNGRRIGNPYWIQCRPDITLKRARILFAKFGAKTRCGNIMIKDHIYSNGKTLSQLGIHDKDTLKFRQATNICQLKIFCVIRGREAQPITVSFKLYDYAWNILHRLKSRKKLDVQKNYMLIFENKILKPFSTLGSIGVYSGDTIDIVEKDDNRPMTCSRICPQNPTSNTSLERDHSRTKLEQENKENNERMASDYETAVIYMMKELVEAVTEVLTNRQMQDQYKKDFHSKTGFEDGDNTPHSGNDQTEDQYEEDIHSDTASKDEDNAAQSDVESRCTQREDDEDLEAASYVSEHLDSDNEKDGEASGRAPDYYEEDVESKSLKSDLEQYESDLEIQEEYEDVENLEVTEEQPSLLDSGVQDIDSRSICSEFTDRENKADQRSDQSDEVSQDETDDHRWLRENYRKIAQRLDVDELSIYLYEKRVIKDYQLEHIQKCSTHREKSHYLLRLMTRASTANVRRMRHGLSVTDQQELADLPTSRMNHTM